MLKKIVLISGILLAVNSNASMWDNAVDYAKKIKNSETTKKVTKKTGEIWEATKDTSSNVWDHTKKATSKGWEATKEHSDDVIDGAKNLYKDLTK